MNRRLLIIAVLLTFLAGCNFQQSVKETGDAMDKSLQGVDDSLNNATEGLGEKAN